MSGAMLALGAALLAMIAGLLGPAGRAWRLGAGLAVALLAAASWFEAAPAGEVGHPIYAEARDAAGAPVSTVAVLAHTGGRRQVRRMTLRQPVEGAEAALWAAIVLGLLGAGVQLRGWLGARRGRDDGLPAWLGPALPLVGALAPLTVLMGARGRGAGEEGVRAWLARFETDAVQSFTVPELPWTYAASGTWALVVAAGVAAIALASLWIGPRDRTPARLGALAAALAGVALMWHVLTVGGVAWRPVDAALWATAGLLALAWFDRASPIRAATLVAPALALAAIAVGG